MTADDKYPVQDCQILPLPIQMQLSENEKLFLNLLPHFWNLYQILNILKDYHHSQKIIIIANLFPKLQTVKNLVRTLSKKRRFRTKFDSQHVKAFQILAKSPWEPFYHVFSSFSEILISKMRRLVLGEISGAFVNTLTAEVKYPVLDCDNLPLHIQMQFSEKRKTFFECFVTFLQSISSV